jgi:glyoxylase-like metal-dependent hydrolase (beta-lactamase superfamily II)
MKYLSFTCNPLQENTFLLWDEETREAAIVDCGAWNRHEEQLLEGSIAAHGLKLKYALQTHAHFDHTFGLPFVYRIYKLKPIFHVDEAETYRQMPNMAAQFGLNIGGGMPPIEQLLNDGDELKLGEKVIRLIHTPGHTPGSSSFYCPDQEFVICGDTLFQGSIGRTDLPGGNFETELDSIQNKLFCLPDETAVLCGHGPSTTIGWERQHNYAAY